MADIQEPPLKRRKGKEAVPSEPKKSLNLEIDSASAVRERLGIIYDSNSLNPLGLATMEFSLKRGLIFTVRNDENSVCAMLFLDTFVEETLICTQRSVMPRYLQLYYILNFLHGATDDHCLSIFQYEGSPNELHFMITSSSGIGCSKQLKMDLTETNFKGFTRIHPLCKVEMKPDTLTEILEHLREADHRSVLVEEEREVWKISSVGDSDKRRSWSVRKDILQAGVNHRYRALFRLLYLSTVSEASFMAKDAYIFLLGRPRNHTLVHIEFKDFGRVSFHYTAQELKIVGADGEDAAQSTSHAASQG